MSRTILGCHLSVSAGFFAMGEEALSIDANTFQFFTRNPRGSKAKAIDPADVQRLLDLLEKEKFGRLLAHAPYTLNPCSKDERVREFAAATMADDLERLRYLPGAMYNFHPGSHVGQGIDVGIELIAKQLNDLLDDEGDTLILLETMAGKGSEVGSTFEELKRIIDLTEKKERLGVCIDTCHLNDAGYDVKNDIDGVLETFDKVIGIERIRAVHVNDSKNEVGARKDRHAKIGEGTIGLEAILTIMRHPALKDLPFYLETPNDVPGYQEEIKLLRSHLDR
ncbi:MAG TPA: deoxyribonuclease IV [Fastidiosipila sp.]|nr:deoxyribonuclease IV [Fastidiosipila sp.]